MVNYKEILRLLHEGYSQREIERSLHTSRRKIREFLDAAAHHNITWPLEEAVTNEQLEEECELPQEEWEDELC